MEIFWPSSEELSERDTDDDSDTSSESETDEDDMYCDDSDTPLPLATAIPPNFILVFPTWSGRKAKRHPKKGSWMISALSQVVMKHDFAAGGMNLLQTLTKVAANVALREAKVIKKERKRTERKSKQRKRTKMNKKL